MADENINPAFKISIDGNDQIDFGVTADHVQITWTEDGHTYNYTLKDFFDNWRNFKENNTFIYYGEKTPDDVQNDNYQYPIKVWYDTGSWIENNSEEGNENPEG